MENRVFDPAFNRNTWFIIFGLFGAMALSIGLSNCPKDKEETKPAPKPKLVYYQSPMDHPKIRYFSELPDKTYLDEQPFGSLDSVKEKNQYGTEISRKPKPEDHKTFTRLEKEAREKGLLKD
ncbi:hypothetical protein KY326_00770 [Candidatus Woesearchaeota archaeon]|nr:hypothetical protein [Candidatus Woesearchaeota archaeon]